VEFQNKFLRVMALCVMTIILMTKLRLLWKMIDNMIPLQCILYCIN
jgi:hypothetical protein